MTVHKVYTFCECPDCEYTIVVGNNGHTIYCPLCIEDCGHFVQMAQRPARSGDQPEGFDAREETQVGSP